MKAKAKGFNKGGETYPLERDKVGQFGAMWKTVKFDRIFLALKMASNRRDF